MIKPEIIKIERDFRTIRTLGAILYEVSKAHLFFQANSLRSSGMLMRPNSIDTNRTTDLAVM